MKTKICSMLGIDYPIIQAGMGIVAGGKLAAAISEAGGLGTIGASQLTTVQLRTEIRLARKFTTKPLAVDIIFPLAASNTREEIPIPGPLPKPIHMIKSEMKARSIKVEDYYQARKRLGTASLEEVKEKLQICLDEDIPVIACGLSTPNWVVQQCHSKGVKVISIVGKVSHALKAVSAGTDVIVAQGTEGGGHTGSIGTLTLVPQVIRAVDVPVLAAGGVATGSQIAAALALGAEGVWVGTRFLATQESAATEEWKQAVLTSKEDSTIRSPLYDGLHVRMIRNRFTDVWEGYEQEIQPFPIQRLLILPLQEAAEKAGLVDYEPLVAGQGSALMNEAEIPSAKDVFWRLVEEMNEALETLYRRRLT